MNIDRSMGSCSPAPFYLFFLAFRFLSFTHAQTQLGTLFGTCKSKSRLHVHISQSQTRASPFGERTECILPLFQAKPNEWKCPINVGASQTRRFTWISVLIAINVSPGCGCESTLKPPERFTFTPSHPGKQRCRKLRLISLVNV